MTHEPHSAPMRRREFCLSALAAGAVGGWLLPGALAGQQPPSAKPVPTPAPAPRRRAPPPRRPAPKKKSDEKAPRPVTLETRDGVLLRAVYFPGSHGKETVPLVMLHGWEQQGSVWEPLAVFLQRSFGHAVIVPDLRGHGQSMTQTIGGRSVELDPEKMTPAQMEAMVWDVQACKKFLEEENNNEQLNLEMLTVVGAEYGALLATRFAALDWSWPVLTTGKQGQDVKALALLTPMDRFKRITAADALRALRAPIASGRFSILLVAGEQDRSGFGDAKRIHRQLQGMLPARLRDKGNAPDSPLWLETPNTNSQGTQLIEPQRRLGVERVLSDFINHRVAARKTEFDWSKRTSPLAR